MKKKLKPLRLCGYGDSHNFGEGEKKCYCGERTIEEEREIKGSTVLVPEWEYLKLKSQLASVCRLDCPRLQDNGVRPHRLPSEVWEGNEMTKLYILSQHPDREVEDAIHVMSETKLRCALYLIARGDKFDEAMDVAVFIGMDKTDNWADGASKCTIHTNSAKLHTPSGYVCTMCNPADLPGDEKGK